ncbi:hypothetical protein P3L10_030334 [Capsicum annuum]
MKLTETKLKFQDIHKMIILSLEEQRASNQIASHYQEQCVSNQGPSGEPLNYVKLWRTC